MPDMGVGVNNENRIKKREQQYRQDVKNLIEIRKLDANSRLLERLRNTYLSDIEGMKNQKNRTVTLQPASKCKPETQDVVISKMATGKVVEQYSLPKSEPDPQSLSPPQENNGYITREQLNEMISKKENRSKEQKQRDFLNAHRNEPKKEKPDKTRTRIVDSWIGDNRNRPNYL